jgi:hypothetical protein
MSVDPDELRTSLALQHAPVARENRTTLTVHEDTKAELQKLMDSLAESGDAHLANHDDVVRIALFSLGWLMAGAERDPEEMPPKGHDIAAPFATHVLHSCDSGVLLGADRGNRNDGGDTQ